MAEIVQRKARYIDTRQEAYEYECEIAALRLPAVCKLWRAAMTKIKLFLRSAFYILHSTLCFLFSIFYFFYFCIFFCCCLAHLAVFGPWASPSGWLVGFVVQMLNANAQRLKEGTTIPNLFCPGYSHRTLLFLFFSCPWLLCSAIQQITLTFKICPAEIRAGGNYEQEKYSSSSSKGKKREMGTARQAAVHYARAKKKKRRNILECKYANTGEILFPLLFFWSWIQWMKRFVAAASHSLSLCRYTCIYLNPFLKALGLHHLIYVKLCRSHFVALNFTFDFSVNSRQLLTEAGAWL